MQQLFGLRKGYDDNIKYIIYVPLPWLKCDLIQDQGPYSWTS